MTPRGSQNFIKIRTKYIYIKIVGDLNIGLIYPTKWKEIFYKINIFKLKKLYFFIYRFISKIFITNNH